MMGQEELGTLAQVVPHMMVLVGHVIRGQVAHVIQILEAQALTVLVIVDKRCTKYKHLTIASTPIVKAALLRNAAFCSWLRKTLRFIEGGRNATFMRHSS
jgi:hypothetical protein